MMSVAPLELRRYSDVESAVAHLAREGVAQLKHAIESHGTASLALTGGSAPGHLYRIWASDYADAIDWQRVHFFWGDERVVPHEHPESNVVTTAPLFAGLQIDPKKYHPWACDLPPQQALEQMQQVLAKADVLNRGFDLTLLGVGPDGHVASLFPGHEPWRDDSPHPSAHGLVAYLDDSPKPPAERFTFTLELLNQSQVTYLLPFGTNKTEALNGLLAGDPTLTVSHVRAQDELIAWTDIPA